jgi:hypothetical protein
MADIEELDRIWREGLSSAAETMTPLTDPTAHVARRIRRRRRACTVFTTVGVAVTVLVIVLTVSVARDAQRDDFATGSPVVVRVEVLVDNTLRIQFPGRPVSGQPPHVEIPHGLIRFEVRSPSGGSDHIIIRGVPEFDVVVSGQETVTEVVRIPRGRYVMYSAIPGHAEAGETVVLVVK